MTANTHATDAPAGAQPSGPDMTALPLAVGSVAAQVWIELGAEAVRFLCTRLQHDMKAQQAMLACKSMDELRAVQLEFLTAAQQHYAAEAGKILDLLGNTASRGLSVSGLKRRYDDVPL